MRESYKITSFLLLLRVISFRGALVTIDQGTINGTTLVARNGREFNAFFGIPFAEPPIRFQPPVEAKPWDGIRDGSVVSDPCVQWRRFTNITFGKEDCLHVNVYTPLNATEGDNLPVMFYVFGGVYKESGNMLDGPHYFMQYDVIIVVPNYRLGPLGFLSTGDTVISGNFGLKDQNLALKWTQKNIYNFGGDPNRVTLHGHSSGAVNVHMHTLSPLSNGLFQQVIMQSGSAFCSLSYFDRKVAQNVAKELAKVVNCNTESSEEMYTCFMQQDASTLVLATEALYVWDKDPDAAFRPSIEDKNVEGAFLTEIPQKMKHQNTSLPWLIGLTTGEGAFKASRYLDVNTNGTRAKEINDHYKLLFPVTLQYLWNTKPKYMDYVSKILRTHYFQNQTIGPGTAEQLTQLYTHGLFGVCAIETIHRYSGPKHVYWYNYLSSFPTQNDGTYYPEILGISHSDEIHLLFFNLAAATRLSEQDVMFSEELVKRWTNFIQTGDPNVPEQINETVMSYWEPMTSDNIEYLKIDINGTMETGLYKKVYPFWRSLPLFSKYFN